MRNRFPRQYRHAPVEIDLRRHVQVESMAERGWERKNGAEPTAPKTQCATPINTALEALMVVQNPRWPYIHELMILDPPAPFFYLSS